MDAFPSKEKIALPIIPKIYRLIEEGATIETIADQIREDIAYSGQRELERASLGIEELSKRGQKGREQLRRLSREYAAQSFGQAIQNAYEYKGPLSAESFALDAGVDFGSRFIPESPYDKLLEYAYEEAQERGLFQGSLAAFKKRENRPTAKIAPHVSGAIEKEIYANSITFGVNEPTYCFLVGARETLRLRTLQKPRFLLLGSYGKYSAQEFSSYARKIHPDIAPTVIDSQPRSIDAVKNGVSDVAPVQADARLLPFAENSFDHIYTNHLFRFLEHGFLSVFLFKASVEDVMNEASRTLKPGGSLVIAEHRYGRHQRQKDVLSMALEINELARKAGLESVRSQPLLSYVLRADASRVEIDECGFPNFGPAPVRMTSIALAMRFVKPE